MTECVKTFERKRMRKRWNCHEGERKEKREKEKREEEKRENEMRTRKKTK